MLTKVSKKGLNAVLIVSMLGMSLGSYIPTAYAEVTDTQESQTTTLTRLEIEGIKLDQDFSADLNQYSATVNNGVQTINLYVESGHPGPSIEVNGKDVSSGEVESLTLKTGENVFFITVRNASNSLNTYILTVTREKNSNNSLRDIKLSKGKLSQAFSADKTDYTVQVQNDTTAITVLPSAVEKTAMVEVNGSEVKADGVSVKVPNGTSNILIVATAENGLKKSYTLHVTRGETSAALQTNQTNTTKPANTNLQANANQNNPTQSSRASSLQQVSFVQSSQTVSKTSKATLSALTVSKGSWDSTFLSGEYTYHIAVSAGVDSITLHPTATYSSSSILIDGSTNKTIQLDDDNKTTITVVVKNADDDRKTYVLIFDKEE